jgi:hypothetical protein
MMATELNQREISIYRSRQRHRVATDIAVQGLPVHKLRGGAGINALVYKDERVLVVRHAQQNRKQNAQPKERDPRVGITP